MIGNCCYLCNYMCVRTINSTVSSIQISQAILLIIKSNAVSGNEENFSIYFTTV